jgi:hypothetical protein
MTRVSMYKPDKKKLNKYLRENGEAKSFDVHAWLRDLSLSEREKLLSEVLAAESRTELSPYAVQFYGHFCEHSEDKKLHQIERDFVAAQLEERPPEEIAKLEDMYFERAQELMRLQGNTEHRGQ